MFADDTILLIYAAAALLTALTTSVVTAPYGRHGRPGWGPTVPNIFGWILMEAPAPLAFAAFSLPLWGADARTTIPAALFLVHYVDRAFLYPFRLRAPGRRMPLMIAASGAAFNIWNGWINATFLARGPSIGGLGRLHPQLGAVESTLGVMLFIGGFALNRDADRRLRDLRSDGSTEYRVPHGGFYRFVSSPNYLGEILMWTGFALVARNAAAWLFVLFTAANLAPRARSHHRWYQGRFPDYPKDRKALIPWLW